MTTAPPLALVLRRALPFAGERCRWIHPSLPRNELGSPPRKGTADAGADPTTDPPPTEPATRHPNDPTGEAGDEATESPAVDIIETEATVGIVATLQTTSGGEARRDVCVEEPPHARRRHRWEERRCREVAAVRAVGGDATGPSGPWDLNRCDGGRANQRDRPVGAAAHRRVSVHVPNERPIRRRAAVQRVGRRPKRSAHPAGAAAAVGDGGGGRQRREPLDVRQARAQRRLIPPTWAIRRGRRRRNGQRREEGRAVGALGERVAHAVHGCIVRVGGLTEGDRVERLERRRRRRRRANAGRRRLGDAQPATGAISGDDNGDRPVIAAPRRRPATGSGRRRRQGGGRLRGRGRRQHEAPGGGGGAASTRHGGSGQWPTASVYEIRIQCGTTKASDAGGRPGGCLNVKRGTVWSGGDPAHTRSHPIPLSVIRDLITWDRP